MGLAVYIGLWLACFIFWTICLIDIFSGRVFNPILLASHLFLGGCVGVFVAALDLCPNFKRNGRGAGGKLRLKAAYKKELSHNLLSLFGGFCISIIFWMPTLFHLILDLNEKRKGAPYGRNGGGYIYKERSWRKLIRDEMRGIKGQQ
jgi:hypothetical protein